MNAFISWLHSTEPCTPAQAAAVMVAVGAVMCFDFWFVAWISKRGKK